MIVPGFPKVAINDFGIIGRLDSRLLLIDGMNGGGRAVKLPRPPTNKYIQTETSSNYRDCREQVGSQAGWFQKYPAGSVQPHDQQIKLAIDVHAVSIVVVRMIDSARTRLSPESSSSKNIR